MRNASDLSITVQHNIGNEQLVEIQRLRYQIYADDLKLQLAAMDHGRKLLPDAMDRPAIHIYAKMGTALSGAVRLNCNSVPPGLERVLESDSLPRPLIYCSRLFILSDFRGSSVMTRLTRACFAEFARLGAAVAICHCYPHLLNLYRRMGFESYGQPFAVEGLEHLGVQTPMACKLEGSQRRADTPAM